EPPSPAAGSQSRISSSSASARPRPHSRAEPRRGDRLQPVVGGKRVSLWPGGDRLQPVVRASAGCVTLCVPPRRTSRPRTGGSMPLNAFQQELCTTSTWDFSDLRALFVNCTLKPSPALSNTQGLMDIAIAIMEANGVTVDQFRAVDYVLAPG